MTSEAEEDEDDEDDEEGADAAEEKEREEDISSSEPRFDPPVIVMNGSLRQVMETGAWADVDMTGKVVGKMERGEGNPLRNLV